MIKFKQINDTEIKIMKTVKDKEDVEIGQIFSPSGSGKNNLNAIQVCGFSEAFDFWGCAHYEEPVKDNIGLYKMDNNNEIIYKQCKDIQLQFDSKTRLRTKELSTIMKTCIRCYNTPCTCEKNYGNPYVTKRSTEGVKLLKKAFSQIIEEDYEVSSKEEHEIDSDF